MKRVLFITTLYFLTYFTTNAQNVGISADGSKPDSSAMLDIKSNSKGMLLPRMTKEEKLAIKKPANGLFVYQTDDTTGLWYFSLNKWIPLQDQMGNHTIGRNLRTNGQFISHSGDSLGIQLRENGGFALRTRQTYPYTRPDHEVFRMDEYGAFYSKGEIGWGTMPITGEGTRFMWYPFKVALRAGYAYDEFNENNVGFYSWAGGYMPAARGIYSFAFGNTVQANGSGSTAFGATTVVDGQYSFAAGIRNNVIGDFATSFGYNNKVLGDYATALGKNTTAGGEGSATLGTGTVAKGYSSTVVGMYNDSLLLKNIEVTNVQDNNPLFIVGNGSAPNDRSNAMVVRKNGATEVKVLQAQSGLQIGYGSTITRKVSGTVQVGPSTSKFKTVTVNFEPTAFAATPMVLATAKAQEGTDYNDTFVVTVRSITANAVTFNIVRVDTNVGWGQYLQLDYMAWTQY